MLRQRLNRKAMMTGLLLIILSGHQGLTTNASQAPKCDAASGRIEQITVPSTVFAKPVATEIYFPPCYEPDPSDSYPVIYLLHGGGADETQWPDLNIQMAADALIHSGISPFLVIMPGATYTENVDYGAFVIKDLLPNIEATYKVQSNRSGRAIGGLSLGGYWALKIAFTHPDLFAAVGAYSPVVNFGQTNDLLMLARRASPETLDGLHIALDVGDLDSLAPGTRQLASILRSRGVPVTLTVGHGGHNRPYWRAHSSDYLRFFLATLMAHAHISF